ncbi:YajG family lipoprotein [Geomonas sp.]|uniref:YajG family lipoprotein n=1 Tax=Geomonas sp. TaxID=2651584 RepID=UPI002B4922F7|nr:YajG family lipoprotein [Geomonas sp.]HJV33720.1 YajG family lipoprotein [Geomonas sp.]
MERVKCGLIRVLAMAAIFAGLLGCATPDRRADILYRPAANVTGGSGDLYLVQGVRRPAGESASIQWVLGKVTDDDGKQLANIVTDMAPSSLVLDALNQELKRAGYNVILRDTAPADANKALILKEATILVNDTHTAVKDEVKSTVKIAVEPRRQGTLTGVSAYEAQYSDTGLTDRDHLPADVLQKTLQLLMTRAVPDMVKVLEQK